MNAHRRWSFLSSERTVTITTQRVNISDTLQIRQAAMDKDGYLSLVSKVVELVADTG